MKRQKISLIFLTLLFAALTVTNFAKPADAYSKSERRALAQRPALTWQALRSGSYMRLFEDYAADQFPLREPFRRLKAGFSRNVLRKKDDRGYYLAAGHLSKLEYPLQRRKWDSSMDAIREIYSDYLESTDCRVYFAMIPDKNCYLAPAGGYPSLDYDALEDGLSKALPFAAAIDLSDTLTLDSFYRTDPHWRQEAIVPTARRLAGAMGAELRGEFTQQHLDAAFSGAYAGQAALLAAPDTLCWLTSPALESCEVTSFDTGAPVPVPVYDMEKARGRDPYEMFLGGADALLVIENPAAETDRELVIFRDSFGSAIAPLLASGYRRITLVDLRYMRADSLARYLRFDDQDVLFLYSTTLLNGGLLELR